MSRPDTNSTHRITRRAARWLLAASFLVALVAPAPAAAAAAPAPAPKPAAATGKQVATATGRTFSVPFSDPSRPGTLKIDQTQGSIHVEAYDGREVQFELRLSGGDSDRDDEGDERRSGLRRFAQPSFQTEVTEESNFMELESDSSWARTVDVYARVPRHTNLQLECVHSCDLVVQGVMGDHELSNTHGSIEATGVSGSVVAETTHGDVKVVFTAVDAGRSMAFSSFHGDVDVTFPSTLKAEVRIDPGNHGEVYTGFDIQPIERPTEMREERDGKRTRVVIEREARGTINGGGPEISFETWNGTIYIRKKGA
jgi:hypothetical protein